MQLRLRFLVSWPWRSVTKQLSLKTEIHWKFNGNEGWNWMEMWQMWWKRFVPLEPLPLRLLRLPPCEMIAAERCYQRITHMSHMSHIGYTFYSRRFATATARTASYIECTVHTVNDVSHCSLLLPSLRDKNPCAAATVWTMLFSHLRDRS